MYLHRIDLHGFKSFADKTAVQFDPGVTAIVGPNGCGKSNIIDAVRWVLGEQRARLLRSEKMESVIFNGTATRRALGMAEVLLTIHNTRGILPTEYSEVTVGRRLYRSGESEYLLNGTACRLKDILDLFMDTGMGPGAYSVIELKMIEDILSESAQDRRRLFEEAAGITKYKLRRAQALRRLDATQADLDRLRDLTEEIARSVKSLSRQAKKAERHRDLTARLRQLERRLAVADRARLAAEQEALRSEEAELEDALAAYAAQLQTAEAEGEAQRTALVEQERALQEAQRALNRHVGQIRQAEAEARLAAERRGAAEAALARLTRETEADAGRRAALGEEAEVHAGQIVEADAANTEADAAETARAEALQHAQAAADAARARLADADTAARQAAGALREAERVLETRRSRHAVLEQERERTAAQQAATEAARDLLGAREAEAEAARATAQEALAGAEAALAEAEAARVTLDVRLEEQVEALRAVQRRHDAARAEAEVLGALLDSTEGLSDATQALLEDPSWADTPPRTVTDLLTCPPPLRRAVDAALGPLADCLVVQTEAEAYAGAARLRDEEAGRATFLVLDRLPERGPQVLSPTPPGTEALATAVSAPDPAHQKLARTLLANWFATSSLEVGERLERQYPVARFVTPSGEWLSGGALRAGGEEKTGSAERLGRREQYEAARGAQEAAAAEMAALEAATASLRTERSALGTDAARDALRAAERALAAADRAAAQARLSAETEIRRQEERAARLVDLDAQIVATQSTAEEAAAVQAAEAQLAEADAARGQARDAAAEAEAAAREALARHSEARVAAANARTRAETLRLHRDRALQTLADLDDRSAAREVERVEVEAALVVAVAQGEEEEAAATALREGFDALDTAAKEAETTMLQTRSAISDTEARLREARRLREAARERQAAGQLRLAELQARLEALIDRLWADHGLRLDELEPPPEDFDPAAARDELPDLRQALRDLGAVNELALETYQEEKERLDFLLAQQADLEGAEASLRDTIREINTTARARFEETFAAIRTEFQRLFVELFGENASADIALAGDDPLEDDIAITARPKGKKPSAITQLSGGEKTLTAIALLFAIYLVKPSPFCILDEVDAPLDDANVERFMRLIRAFADSTQFVLVTHNKLTMEAADRMYGVTMQEEGVSRLVGVRFDHALPEAA